MFEFQSSMFDVAADQMNDTKIDESFPKTYGQRFFIDKQWLGFDGGISQTFPFFSFFLSNFKQKINIIIRKLFEFSTVDFSKFEFCSVIIMIFDFYKKRTLKYGGGAVGSRATLRHYLVVFILRYEIFLQYNCFLEGRGGKSSQNLDLFCCF